MNRSGHMPHSFALSHSLSPPMCLTLLLSFVKCIPFNNSIEIYLFYKFLVVRQRARARYDRIRMRDASIKSKTNTPKIKIKIKNSNNIMKFLPELMNYVLCHLN